MSLRALLFDVDGTLADTEEVHRQAFNAAFAERNLRWRWGPEEYARLLAVSGGKERIAHYIDGLDVPPVDKGRLKREVPELHRAKTRHYAALLAQGALPLRAGVEPLLREARAAGLKLAVASTTTPDNLRALIEHCSPAGSPLRFDVVATGDEVPHKKPAPDIYRLALERLGLTAEDCIAFEDSGNGVSAAKAAGLYTVVTPTFWTAADDVSAADLRLHALDQTSLTELAGRRARARLEPRSVA